MKRKTFLRNALMAIAISFLPKTLLPSDGTIEEEMVEVEVVEYKIALGATRPLHKSPDYYAFEMELNIDELITKKTVSISEVAEIQERNIRAREGYKRMSEDISAGRTEIH